MQYPLRDDAYRNRLLSYGPSFPDCGVTKEKLAEAGFRVSEQKFEQRDLIKYFSMVGWKIKLVATIATEASKAGKKAIVHLVSFIA